MDNDSRRNFSDIQFSFFPIYKADIFAVLEKLSL